jgi:hypothetical protein
MLGYASLTILLWIVFGDKTFLLETTSATGYYAKVAELCLLAFLFSDMPKTS